MVRFTFGLGDRPAGNYIQFGTVNVGTIIGTGNEVVEMLTCRKVNICCLQEVDREDWLEGKDSIYKFF